MMKYMINILNRTDKRILFVIFSLILVLCAVALNRAIITDKVYFNTYSDQLGHDRIETLIHYRKRLEWIGYLMVPAGLAAKLLLITLSIQIGLLFINYRIRFRSVFHVVLVSESVFIIAQILRIMILYLMDLNTLEDINNFYPLSLESILNAESVPGWFIYPLKMANLFTVIYFFILACGLSAVLKRKPARMMLFTLSTFGVCLSLWIMLIMFINIHFS
jgi:hypothetical protein